VQETLDSLMAGKTTISITHRLDTLKAFGRILVMSKGRLQESGTEKELVEHLGYLFDAMRSSQSIDI
jgi:ABC-type multidrug transport system fused ATPase/permease subunit